MTPAEQKALEGLAGRALSADEIVALAPLLAIRNDVAIAARLSVGRTRLVPHTITARGVRAALPIPQGSRFLLLLREAASAAAIPDWLVNALATATDVHISDYPAYLDAFACAHEWLQGAGLDLGDPTTRAMLDLIVAGNPDLRDAVATLKALAVADDPIPFDRVSAVLNKAQGLITL